MAMTQMIAIFSQNDIFYIATQPIIDRRQRDPDNGRSQTFPKLVAAIGNEEDLCISVLMVNERRLVERGWP